MLKNAREKFTISFRERYAFGAGKWYNELRFMLDKIKKGVNET